MALRVRHGMGAGEQGDEAEKGDLERHDFRRDRQKGLRKRCRAGHATRTVFDKKNDILLFLPGKHQLSSVVLVDFVWIL